MIKVLHLLNTNKFSGAENVACQIIDMYKNDVNIKMAYCSLDGPISTILEKKDITFFPLNRLNKRELMRIVDVFRPDIIHAHDVYACVLASICHKNTKLIGSIHGNDPRMRCISVKSLSSLLICREADHIFWVSKSCFDKYVFNFFCKKKSSILYNVINIDELYSKVNSDTLNYNYDIVYIGRLNEIKNPKRLLKVFQLIIRKLPDVRIGIIGTGELEDFIKTEIREKSLEMNIQLLGYMENPLKILASSKVMVMTSRWEGTPMVVLEAMGLGIPIVSTPTDGIIDFVQNDENGYLSDEDEILVEKAISYINKSEKEKEKIKERAIKIFNEKNNVEAYKKILDSYYTI